MRRIPRRVAAALATACIAWASPAFSQECPPPPRDWAPPRDPAAVDFRFPHRQGQLLARIAKPHLPGDAAGMEAKRRALLRDFGLREELISPSTGLVRLRVGGAGDDEALKQLIGRLAASGLLTDVRPNYCTYTVPTTSLSENNCSAEWPLERIDAASAWAITKGNKNVVVAVLDSGIATGHIDLTTQLWDDACEQFDGIDNGCPGESGNSKIDDLHGWNFVKNSASIEDDVDHGSQVSGVIGAVHDNNECIQGVNAEVSLMVLKIRDDGVGDVSQAVEAIDYAIAGKAAVLNLSWDTANDVDLEAALERAGQARVVAVAAAGRGELDAGDLDSLKSYPCSFELPNVICVAGAPCSPETNERAQCAKKLGPGSSWGKSTVHLSAPGESILSTARIISTTQNTRCSTSSGPSLAAPFVAGVAALIRACKPEATAADVVQFIVSNVKPIGLDDCTSSGGRLDAGAALRAACGPPSPDGGPDPTPP